MVFEIDPDKPDIPGIARILSGMGIVSLLASALSIFLAFSRYSWVNENFAMAGAIGAFVLALIFVGQAKTIELLALVSARVKSRFAIEGLTKGSGAASLLATTEKKPTPVTQPAKERIIHVPDAQAREQGFKVR